MLDLFNSTDSFFKDRLKDDILTMEKFMLTLIKVEDLELKDIVTYLIGKKSKYLRSMLLLLVSYLCNNKETSEYHFRVSSVIELMHIATLYHDDVIDQSDYRRSSEALHIKTSNSIAILAGDLLFASIGKILIDNNELNLFKSIIYAYHDLVVGQLKEEQLSRKEDVSINTVDKYIEMYMDIIKLKTSTLMVLAVDLAVMPIINTLDKNTIKNLREYALLLGYAFQIKDDIDDILKESSDIGKTSHHDLTQNRYTLPLLLSIKYDNLVPDNHTVKELYTYLRTSSGLKKSINKLHFYKEKMINISENLYIDSSLKKMLISLVKYFQM